MGGGERNRHKVKTPVILKPSGRNQNLGDLPLAYIPFLLAPKGLTDLRAK